MGRERREHTHAIDIRCWSLSCWDLWVDQVRAFIIVPLSWGHLDLYFAPCTGCHAGWICRFGRPGYIPEDAGRCQDWLPALSRWWHSQEKRHPEPAE